MGKWDGKTGPGLDTRNHKLPYLKNAAHHRVYNDVSETVNIWWQKCFNQKFDLKGIQFLKPGKYSKRHTWQFLPKDKYLWYKVCIEFSLPDMPTQKDIKCTNPLNKGGHVLIKVSSVIGTDVFPPYQAGENETSMPAWPYDPEAEAGKHYIGSRGATTAENLRAQGSSWNHDEDTGDAFINTRIEKFRKKDEERPHRRRRGVPHLKVTEQVLGGEDAEDEASAQVALATGRNNDCADIFIPIVFAVVFCFAISRGIKLFAFQRFVATSEAARKNGQARDPSWCSRLVRLDAFRTPFLETT